MKLFPRHPKYKILAFFLFTVLAACGHRGSGKQEETLYVTAPQTFLRDRVAPVYTKTGTVRNGDPVTILERGKRWERVRNAKGEEGWLQDRYLVGEDVFSGFQQLYRQHQNDPVQAHGILRNDFRLHLTPGRDTDRLFLLKDGDKVEMLQRMSVAKSASSAPPPPTSQQASAASPEKQDASDAAKEEEKEYKGKEKPATPPISPAKKPVEEKLSPKEKTKHEKLLAAAPAAPMEDWWLVRDYQRHAGWVLGRMIDIDVPLEIAQYAEGQRIVAFFPLTTVHDSEENKDEPYYLVLLSEPQDGMPFDYDQVRVFSWNLRKHRYETAYRDRNIFGVLPVSVGRESFEKLGDEPTFTIRVRDEEDKISEQKYRLEGVIVKRVLAPGETPVRAAQAIPSRGKDKRRR